MTDRPLMNPSTDADANALATVRRALHEAQATIAALRAKLDAAQAMILEKEQEAQRQRENKDQAYHERNQLVALLASMFPSGIARTNIEGWSPEWHGCVYIDFPWGQASWHYHDSQAYLFDHLPPYRGQWDGHTTEQKYAAIFQHTVARTVLDEREQHHREVVQELKQELSQAQMLADTNAIRVQRLLDGRDKAVEAAHHRGYHDGQADARLGKIDRPAAYLAYKAGLAGEGE